MQSSVIDKPAGPLQREHTSPQVRRIWASAVALACAALLGVALFVTPAQAGLGSHEQLNLPKCGWIMSMDVPCVTCGMTTAFSHAARGSFLQSILAQPLGFLLAMATAMTLLVAVYVALTGSQVTRMFSRLWAPRMLWLLAALAVGSWVFKIVTYKGLVA